MNTLRAICLLAFCGLLASCHSQNAKIEPSVQFISVPLAGEGGPDRSDRVEGRVVGALPGQQIVLYARSGQWWVQPLADHPFTAIQPDSTWKNSTHYGTEYAALLVDSGYRPPPTLNSLPGEGNGVIAIAATKGRPVFWQTWWFMLSTAAIFAMAVLTIFQVRMRQVSRQLALRVEERLTERTRIAQELHDTLLQDFLSVSMQLHLANDQLPDDSPAKSVLNRVLGQMKGVIDEGRNAVHALRAAKRGSQALGQALSEVPAEVAPAHGSSFRVIVEGMARPLKPLVGDDIYLVGREAIANAFRHSGATEIVVELYYARATLQLVVRDNGRGIDDENPRSRHEAFSGLQGMRERAERIGAKLRVLSRVGAGTEIEFSVPGPVAYLDRDSDRPVKWFSKPAEMDADEADSPAENERVL